MLSFTGSLKIFIALDPIDMRAGVNTLSALVAERLKETAQSGALFVFTHKRRRLIKVLYWDGTGMWLMLKRLEQGTFCWPRAAESGQSELMRVPKGPHESVKFRSVPKKRCCKRSGVSVETRMNVSPSEAPTLLHTALQRLAAQSATCKLWSVALTSLVLIMAAGRAGAEMLVWAAGPSLLLALADAAYKVQAARIAALGSKETLRVEDLFRLQSGSLGFSGTIQALGGLASFSVWPFYATLTTVVIVLGQTVLVPQNKPQIMPQSPATNTLAAYSVQQSAWAPPPSAVVSHGKSGVPQPAAFAQSNGVSSFQPPPNQVTVSRPNMPPMGMPNSKPNSPGAVTKSAPVPGSSSPTPAGSSRPATNTFAPPPPKPPPASRTMQSPLTPKPAASPTQSSK